MTVFVWDASTCGWRARSGGCLPRAPVCMWFAGLFIPLDVPDLFVAFWCCSLSIDRNKYMYLIFVGQLAAQD